MSEAETGNLMGLSLAFLQTEPDNGNGSTKDGPGTDSEGWHLFFDTLLALREGLWAGQSGAISLREADRDFVDECRIRPYFHY